LIQRFVIDSDRVVVASGADFDYRAAIRELRRIQEQSRRYAEETLNRARKRAKEIVDPDAAAFPIGAGGGLQVKIDVLGRNQVRVTPTTTADA